MTDQAADRQFELSIMSYATGVSRPKIRAILRALELARCGGSEIWVHHGD
jgi:hypothetical protein